jgi:hypothetical protein
MVFDVLAVNDIEIRAGFGRLFVDIKG